MSRTVVRVLMASTVVCLMAAVAVAQQATTSETKKFEVIAVEGNTLIVKLPEGTREITVADDFRFNVDGKMLSVRELKPGMAGTATITTRTTMVPVTVTEVRNGTVLQALGVAIIVSTPEGNRMFTQDEVSKRGVKIYRDGKPVQIADLRANDRLSATIVTSMPPRVMTEQEVQASLARSGAPAPAAAAAPAARPATPPAAAPAAAPAPAPAAAPAPKQLPKTASPLPLLGLVGLASLVAGLGLTARRRRTSR